MNAMKSKTADEGDLDRSEIEIIREAVQVAKNKCQIARQAGLTPKAIYDFLKGSDPKLETLERIARAVNLAPPRMIKAQVVKSTPKIISEFLKSIKLDIRVNDMISITEDQARMLVALEGRDAEKKLALAAALIAAAEEDMNEEIRDHPTKGNRMFASTKAMLPGIVVMVKNAINLIVK